MIQSNRRRLTGVPAGDTVVCASSSNFGRADPRPAVAAAVHDHLHLERP
ncbi:hypothetical protein ACWEV3_28315 [Saccharopolyspora sp. NPDC003752]